MKDIKGHKARNTIEIATLIAEKQTYTMCTLPHYRYERSKQSCKALEKSGFIERTKKGRNTLHFRGTPLLRKWYQEAKEKSPFKWMKEEKQNSTPLEK